MTNEPPPTPQSTAILSEGGNAPRKRWGMEVVPSSRGVRGLRRGGLGLRLQGMVLRHQGRLLLQEHRDLCLGSAALPQ